MCLPNHKWDMSHDQWLSRVTLVGVPRFPSPRLIDKPRLKNPICPST